MKMLTTKEISEAWNISERMVRRFCVDGRIPEAKLENGTWMIPAGTAKPKRKPKEKAADPKENLTAFASAWSINATRITTTASTNISR